jgi:hypothetical protein
MRKSLIPRRFFKKKNQVGQEADEGDCSHKKADIKKLLPVGIWAGGKKPMTKVPKELRSPTPATSQMPNIPPGILKGLGTSALL